MESNRFLLDTSRCHGNMLFLGNRDSVIQGARSMMNMESSSSKRRPFFSSPEDLYDEEYYDEQLPGKKRRLTSEQVLLLEKSFEEENKLEPERKTQLAKKLGLQPRQVAVWFQNRRARWKTKQLERDYDLLKSTYDTLLSDYESIVKENEKLKSEVVSLTEKLQTEEETAAEQTEPGQRPEQTGSASQFEQMVVKPEDPLSSGSIGSAVVDEDAPQLVDSCCDSYFQRDQYPACIAPIHSEEDDGSDNGQSYFPDVFVAAADPPSQDNEDALGWWSWA